MWLYRIASIDFQSQVLKAKKLSSEVYDLSQRLKTVTSVCASFLKHR